MSASYRTAFAGLGAMVLVSVHLGRREALVQILTVPVALAAATAVMCLVAKLA